jgi:hypothetical protein
VATKWIRQAAATAIAACAALTAGCGDLAQQGRSPVQLVILSLQGASGAEPDELGSFVLSDVLTMVSRSIDGEDVQVPTIFNDIGQVSMQVVLKDQGVPGLLAEPGPLNAVTITRYRVAYRRADGRNSPGVDVPFGFEGAITFTVPNEGTTSSGFELVRVIAKQEAPLLPLVNSGNFVTTLADITFFGRDLAGNDIQATGSIQVDFGNFADPE